MIENSLFETPIFQVTELVEAINRHLDLLGEVVVEGEISRIDVKNGRLIFATIKDASSAVDVFGLTHQIRNVYQLEAGMKVQVAGIAGLYKGSGKFRMQASSITPVGSGSLHIAFEKLKLQMESEGLFDSSHKRELPAWPRSIGLITAKGSSAYFDVVKILTTRMAGLSILHMPVNVQGAQAIPTILKAISYVNNHAADFDVVILARGGGSIEDLQAFYDEGVVRAVFAIKVPLVSAVGHEDDWSLVDYVADVRASTPSNAAELVVRDKAESLLYVESTVDQLKRTLLYELESKKRGVSSSTHYLKSYFNDLISQTEKKLHHVLRMQQQLLVQIASEWRRRQEKIQRLDRILISQLALMHEKYAGLWRVIESMNVNKVLQRGYSIARNSKGEVLKSIQALRVGETVDITLAQGQLQSTITTIGGSHEETKE